MEKIKIIAGGGLVMNDAGELLMIFRRGKWDLPKGKLDKGETILECAIREVKEETGLTDIEHSELIGITSHEYFDTHIGKDAIKESHWFAMKAPGQQSVSPQTEEDITEIRWVKNEELEECLQNSYSNVIEIIQKADL